MPECKIKLIIREANVMADWLAGNAKKGMCMSENERHLPSSLVRVLDKDSLSAPP